MKRCSNCGKLAARKKEVVPEVKYEPRSSRILRENPALANALLPLIKVHGEDETDEVAHAVDYFQDIFQRQLRESVNSWFPSKLKVRSYVGEREEHDSRTFSRGSYYVIVTHPEQILCSYKFEFDLKKRLGSGLAATSKYLTSLHVQETTELFKELADKAEGFIRSDFPDLDGVFDSEFDEYLEDTMFRSLKARTEVDETEYDSEGEDVEVYESASPDVRWNFVPGKADLSFTAAGSKLLVSVTVPVRVSVKRIYCPGDSGYNGWG